MMSGHTPEPSVCFVGPANLPVLVREYAHHGIGGMQVQQTLLARALVRRGFEVSMVVSDYGQPDGASWDGIRTWRTHKDGAGLPAVRFIHPRWTRTWAALKRADADVYYVSGCSFLVGLTAMFARRYGRGFVYRVASSTDCDPKTLRLKFWRDKKLFSYGLKRADVVLAQTEEQQQMLLSRFGRTSRVASPLQDPPGRSDPLEARTTDVLWIGALRPLKRPQLLIELARQLPQLSFTMAGGPSPDDPGLFDKIRRHADQLPNVKFMGSVPYHDVRALYESARVLVSTSEIEGFPNTYLQAWANGAPVVAFLDPGRMIADHRIGRAVGSMDEMAQAVTSLLCDPAEWTAMSARCREFSIAHADENTKLQPYLETLRAVSPRPHAQSAQRAQAL